MSETGISKAIKLMRSQNQTHQHLHEEFFESTKPLLLVLGASLESLQNTFLREQRSLIKRMRMLCLCENFQSVLMWSHYADNHKGVVLKLKIADTAEEDDPLWLAEKVNYEPTSVPLLTLDQAVGQILGLRPYFSTVSVSKQMATTKHEIWRYENEFRFWSVADEGDESDLFVQFKPSKIEAVILGCRCKQGEADIISKIALERNPKTEIYQAKKHPYDYLLEFDRVQRL